MQEASELEIYVHIPFCVKKCSYCDFLSFKMGEETHREYIFALKNEIREYMSAEVKRKLNEKSYVVTSVFFGGGTPTVLPATKLAEILAELKRCFYFSEDAEITTECNPGTVTAEDLIVLKKAGFNRLSIGLQSANDEELRRIGRIHDFAGFKATYENAVRAGFENINVDIITALPEQSLEDVDSSLEKILLLDPLPKHISSYSLILEEGTEFMRLHDEGKLHLPDEESERLYHWRVIDRLKEAGYEQYELSNMAQSGFECRHNVGYWTGKEYLGFGLGAASYFGNERFSNTRDLKEYLGSWGDGNPVKQRPLSEDDLLTEGDKISEFMFLGLRMTKGISVSEFESRFNRNFEEIFGEITKKHIDEGLLSKTGDRIFLTRRGQDVANYVFSDYLMTDNT